MKWSKLIISTFLLTSLAGCEFAPIKKDDQGQQPQQGDQAQSANLQGGYDIKSLDDPNSPLSRRVIYFELDSSNISAEDREVISAHAKFMAANPQVSAILEGHADERGTREYNIALGERRAKSVQQLFSVQGVSGSQAQVISFGEERPVALEHNEEAWRLNRRVEILYSGY